MIAAKIIDEDDGLQEYKDIKAIRVHSRDYNLLVMKDYTPTIGDIDGDVIFLFADREISFESIKAFYRFRNNIFTLLITRGKDS